MGRKLHRKRLSKITLVVLTRTKILAIMIYKITLMMIDSQP